jgi:hypothetical protein
MTKENINKSKKVLNKEEIVKTSFIKNLQLASEERGKIKLKC